MAAKEEISVEDADKHEVETSAESKRPPKNGNPRITINSETSPNEVSLELHDNDRQDEYGSKTSSNNQGILSFHNLKYSVKIGSPFKKTDKQILRDISGVFEPGLNAIMGPTGGGKTSLLDLLAKRKDVQGLKGDILFEGRHLPDNFKLISGYVVQDDVVMGTLTVRENLIFAANMRMAKTNEKEKTEWINSLITDLGLTKCQHTKIGTELIKGVSGGERKRCNIGMELVTKPKILFLDEPTTGLDASTSFSVISLLRDLAIQGNRTIVFSIHQPRYSIFRLFHKLHLLSCYGETVYHGSAQEAVDFFARQNLICETYNNPPDFFLDIILLNSDPSEIGAAKVSDGNASDAKVDLEEKLNLPRFFKESDENKTLLGKGKVILDAKLDDEPVTGTVVTYASGWMAQFMHLSVRSAKNLVRNPQMGLMPSLMMIVLGFLVGALYFNIKHDLSGFQNLYGALFFCTIQMLFGNMASLEVFISGRNLFLHESANGYYRISTFFASKILADLLPLRAIPTILFSTIFYLMCGLKPELDSYLLFVITNGGATMAACALAFFMSVLFGIYSVALAATSVVFVIMVVFAGLIINISSMPEILQNLKYISIPRYCLAGHSVAQIKGVSFCGERTFISPNGTRTESVCDTGEQLLDMQGIAYAENWDFWKNIIAMWAICIILFALTYLKLRMLQKKK